MATATAARVAEAVVGWHASHRHRHAADAGEQRRPLVVGISGPQGAGKTTLVRQLVDALGRNSSSSSQTPGQTAGQTAGQPLRAVAWSADDAYLPFDRQQAVAAAHADNPLLEYRGLPGTHDSRLVTDTLQRLVAGRLPVVLPSYDKSLRGGRGDRAPPSQWQTVEQPVDVVLFEGWFLGFRPWTPEQTAQLFDRHQQHLHDGAGTLDPPAAMRSVFKYTQHNIAQVMESLAEYERSWYPLMDAFVHIAAEQTDVVYEWRWEQEECMRRDRGDATLCLTRSQVVDFVDRFFPLYELCLPRLLSNGFFEGGDGDGTKTGCCLQLVINRQRQLVSSSTK